MITMIHTYDSWLSAQQQDLTMNPSIEKWCVRSKTSDFNCVSSVSEKEKQCKKCYESNFGGQCCYPVDMWGWDGLAVKQRSSGQKSTCTRTVKLKELQSELKLEDPMLAGQSDNYGKAHCLASFPCMWCMSDSDSSYNGLELGCEVNNHRNYSIDPGMLMFCWRIPQ